MKSIKEKAKEYDRVVECISPNQSIVDMSGRKQFEVGAYYVLDEIERIVNSAIENKSITIPTWRLNYIIKQLKK